MERIYKSGNDYEDIAKRNLRKQTIEQDLERLKEECEKKKKYGPKEMREQQLLEKDMMIWQKKDIMDLY